MMKNLRDRSLEKRRTDWKFNRTMLCPFLFISFLSLLSCLTFSLAFSLIFSVSMSRWRSMTDEAVTADK